MLYVSCSTELVVLVVLIDCSLIMMEVETFDKAAHAKELHREEDVVDDVE